MGDGLRKTIIMAFFDILNELVNGLDGALAATIMGMDGLSVEQYVGGDGYDIETVGVEYGKVIDEIKNASMVLNLGELEEVLVSTAATNIIIRMINPEYYIAFVITHDSNVGKARYLLKKAALTSGKELSR